MEIIKTREKLGTLLNSLDLNKPKTKEKSQLLLPTTHPPTKPKCNHPKKAYS
jgi:hypothetical protein